MAAKRNTQLDGWRALAVLGVMWLHWIPDEWEVPLPLETGLYFFLTLTGFFITRVVLRDRALGKPGIYSTIVRRRALRILIPCFAAFAFAWLVRAPDFVAHPWWYLLQLANFHIAGLPGWPSGTSHYWTLAIQSQFYLIWPLVVLALPRRWLAPACLFTALLAPLSRMLLERQWSHLPQGGAITTCCLDYLGLGAFLAVLMQGGMPADDRRLRTVAWISAAIYGVLYALEEAGHPLAGVRYFKQTFLTIALCGLIAASLSGLPQWLAGLLQHPITQHIAKISYSLYLLHSLVPLALGWVIPWLWQLPETHATSALKMVIFGLSSWGLCWLSWRYIEVPVERWRNRAKTATPAVAEPTA
ncbi:peptidoglycan/LPS O-acetylase OafA/YrhL [Haloferula luteola]|uniref:Peptidoglycan/LPS O-acetylase OafA/YrhL n=1 Tax=Haloferula luteola TaxID=595692 RepID=A0A840V3R7_9BACT|nr:peptidoglycan/LPS O-acetylase OafA/YrhL [Haloferula luteola]